MADLIPLEGLNNLLRLVIDTPYPIHARLFKLPATPDLTTGLADITEANFSGYAPVALAPMVPPVEDDDGVVRSQVVDAVFAHNGGPVANVVHGYFVTIELPAGRKLLWVGQDDDYPFTFSDISSVLDVAVEMLETQEV